MTKTHVQYAIDEGWLVDFATKLVGERSPSGEEEGVAKGPTVVSVSSPSIRDHRRTRAGDGDRLTKILIKTTRLPTAVNDARALEGRGRFVLYSGTWRLAAVGVGVR